MFCCSWDRTGRLLATVCRDKQLRLVEARTGEVTACTRGPGSHQARLSKVGSSNYALMQCGYDHPGLAQVVWITDKNLLLSTGFSRHSERQFALWSPDDLSRPLKLEARTT